MRRCLTAFAFVCALAPSFAAAQTRAAERRGDESTWLRAQFGIPVARRLLAPGSFAQQLRGVERLGAIGTQEAIDALVEKVEGSTDARLRLAAVRVLADQTKSDKVRQFLVREVSDTGRAAGSPLASVLRETAALALARGGDRKAVAALVSTLLRGGSAAEAATLALRVHPPDSLDVLSETKRATPNEPGKGKPTVEPAPENKKRLSPPVAMFLGEIGDLRAIEKLRPMLADAEPAGKIAAAIGLAKLGDEAALPLAREWLGKPEPKLRLAAAEVFVALDAPEATEAVKALIESEVGFEQGLRFPLRAPSPTYAAALAKALPALPREARGRVIAAIGRARGVTELVALLDDAESATDAMFALATMPGPAAREAIAQAMSADGGKKRLARRAATVRELALGDAPSGLRSALEDAWQKKDAIDRAIGAFGLSAIGSMSLDDAIEAACKGERDGKPTCDATILGAAVRGALTRVDGPSSFAPLTKLLARVGDRMDAVTIIAGAALLAHPDGGELPTALLASWAEDGGPLAPLAARALPSRDDEALRGRIKRLFEGSDPIVRAHLALGLARDPEPNAVTRLTDAYRFEEDARVRRAIVRALSKRGEAQRVTTLQRARDLDPDEETRNLARAALEGRDLLPEMRRPRGPEARRSVAWITVRSNDATDAVRAARLVRPDGLAVPVVADPDGVLLVPGLPPGPTSLSLDRP